MAQFMAHNNAAMIKMVIIRFNAFGFRFFSAFTDSSNSFFDASSVFDSISFSFSEASLSLFAFMGGRNSKITRPGFLHHLCLGWKNPVFNAMGMMGRFVAS